MRPTKPLLLACSLVASSLVAAGLAAQRGFNGLEPRFIVDDPGYRIECDNFLTVRPSDDAYWERISKAELSLADAAQLAERVLVEKQMYDEARCYKSELIILGKPFWRFEVFGHRYAATPGGEEGTEGAEEATGDEVLRPAETHRWKVEVGMRGRVKLMLRLERLPGTVVRGPIETLESGVMLYDARHGDGQEVRPDSRVRIHAMALRLDGAILHSTYDEREPWEFDIADPPIAGLKELVGARVGGKRKLVIPADLAFGKEGNPPTIPPYSTLVYDVEILRVL